MTSRCVLANIAHEAEQHGVRTAVTAEHGRDVIDIIECRYRAADTGVTGEIACAFDFPPADVPRSSD